MTPEQRRVFGIHVPLCCAIMAVVIIGTFIPSRVVADGGPLPYCGFGSLLLYSMFHPRLDAVGTSPAAGATWPHFNHFGKAVEP